MSDRDELALEYIEQDMALEELYNRCDKVLRSWTAIRTNKTHAEDKYHKSLYSQLDYLKAANMEVIRLIRMK